MTDSPRLNFFILVSNRIPFRIPERVFIHAGVEG